MTIPSKPIGVGSFLAGKTCSRFLARLMKRHEDRRLRVIQLGTRVTVLVDIGAVAGGHCQCPIPAPKLPPRFRNREEQS